jgi:transcription elongation factor Elf1
MKYTSEIITDSNMDTAKKKVVDMRSDKRYKCPNCKNTIPLRTADFIKGIAMVSCMDCGRDAFAIEETLLGL